MAQQEDSYEVLERACIRHFDANEPWEEALRHAREEQEGGFLPLRAAQDESEHPKPSSATPRRS